jgi:hypothetical protein
MASLVGTIRSGGAGLAGLTVRGYEEIRVGIELDDEIPPCRIGQPSQRLVGTATTDGNGEFRITYTARTRPEWACSFSATVRVVVLDGAAVIWQSPKRTAAGTVRFDHDVLPPGPEPDPESDSRLVGTLTRCGRPATAFRVVGIEEVQVGFPMPPRPCVLSSPRRRQLGIAVVDAQGRFEIRYRATEELEDACRFIARVRVEVFEGNVLVWRSPAVNAGQTVRFDHEFYPGCQAGSALVRVTSETGARLVGAEVFAGGVLRGTTDAQGQIFVADVVQGSTIVARHRLHERKTSRGGHSSGSDQNWSYRVYATSLRLTHDASGNNPMFAPFVVADPSAVQLVVVSRRNIVIGFNVLVSLEWDATIAELTFHLDRMREFSELMFNGTDGQFLVENVSVVDNGRSWDQADFRVLASWNQPSNADVGAIAGDGGRIRMNPFDMMFPGIILHEWGHYAFWVRDEYKPADCWPEGQPVGCTLAAQADGTPFSEGAGKDACFMRGAQFESRKKLCSSHPANPHVNCTSQGSEDCWSVVASRYGGPDWRLLTPANRGVLVDRLPDSGVPMGTVTSPGPGADRADSCVPLAAWKPRTHRSSVERPNPCLNLVVRVTNTAGTPVDEAEVTLHTTDGRTIFQGRTGAKSLPNGIATGPGEIALRGATVGDSVSARLQIGIASINGSAGIASCAAPLVVELSEVRIFSRGMRSRLAETLGSGLRVEAGEGARQDTELMLVRPEGEEDAFAVHPAPGGAAGVASLTAEPAGDELHVQLVAFDRSGHPAVLHGRVARRSLQEAGDHAVRSLGGEVELVLPEGAMRYPADLLFEDAHDVEPPALAAGDAVLVTPQRIAASGGDVLERPVMLHLEAGSTYAVRELRVELLRYDEARRAWRPEPARVNRVPLVASASVDRLGVFCLVGRAGGPAQAR